ncbi:MAG TPA: YebC/PmpR family DNA-binding transcriptional regulator [Gammaproteobacteria bacterium]|nr:YebC/PmpR family DNA-binding transcriptional regulator [Gammaproteobacteria bacterium]
MAGHSKWANIRFRKGAQDARRGKLFTKFIREITVAARMGGSDPDSNPRLRSAIDKGLANNMKRDTIEKAIKRGIGDLEGVNYEEVRYEGYGTAGVAILVDCMTDNHNRSVSEVRHAFSKYNGNLGTDGSVAYLFSRMGIIAYPAGSDEEVIMDVALEAGAEDVVTEEDGSIEVQTTPETFNDVKKALDEAGLNADYAQITERASTETVLDTENAEKLMRLIDALEDLDDVQEVHSNAHFPDDFVG